MTLHLPPHNYCLACYYCTNTTKNTNNDSPTSHLLPCVLACCLCTNTTNYTNSLTTSLPRAHAISILIPLIILTIFHYLPPTALHVQAYCLCTNTTNYTKSHHLPPTCYFYTNTTNNTNNLSLPPTFCLACAGILLLY